MHSQPNFFATASSARTPSGTTSVPMPGTTTVTIDALSGEHMRFLRSLAAVISVHCPAHAYITSMPSSKYALFEQAMRTRKQLICMYQGLPVEGAWRCLFLAQVSDIQLRDGPWISGSRHTLPSTCVEDVDLDVNPNSPYRPKRRIV